MADGAEPSGKIAGEAAHIGTFAEDRLEHRMVAIGHGR